MDNLTMMQMVNKAKRDDMMRNARKHSEFGASMPRARRRVWFNRDGLPTRSDVPHTDNYGTLGDRLD